MYACRSILAIAAGSLVAVPVVAQSVQVTLTPSSAAYPVGWQLAVHAQFCITDPNEHFLDDGTVTQNGNTVALVQYQSPPPGCVDARGADPTITLVDGTNTVTATIQTYLGPYVDVVYTWTETGTYTTPPPPPFVDLSVHNGYNRNIAMCAMACFDNVTSYTTPAYWTLDAPRAATLLYSSGQVESRHIVEFSAATISPAPPNQLTAKLRRADGSYVTLTNGSTVASFTPADSAVHRYAIAFDDSLLSTGAYNYTLVVTGVWSGSVTESTVPVRILVINERTSPYGAGWTVSGVGRVIVDANDSVVTYDGAGTLQFWGAPTSCANWTCTYAPPPGEFDQLKRVTNSGNPAEQWYYRTNVDGTKQTFYNFVANKLISIEDVFGNITRIAWRSHDPDRIDSIVDPVGKAIVFTYDGSNRLASIRDVPGNRTTTVTVGAQNNLTQIQDAAAGKPFQSATYDSFHRLLGYVNRRGDRWATGYDNAGKLAVDSTPSITADTTSGIDSSAVYRSLVTTYRSPQAAGLSAIDSGGIGSVRPALGSSRMIKVNAFGAALEILAPLSEYARYTRNTQSQITESIDSAGHQLFIWSGPRLTRDSNYATGKVVAFEWNTTTNRITRQFGSGTIEQRFFYDISGYRLDSTKVTNQAATRFTYDSRGRMLTTTDPRGHVASTYYDGNPWSNTDSVKVGSRRTWFRYDALAGRDSIVVTPGGRKDSTFYDKLNRVTRTGGPLGDSTRYTYGDSLNLTKITDALGHVTRVEKNAVGWDTLAVDALNANQRYEYDGAGHVKRFRNRRNQVTRFVFDGIGRLTSRILADNRISNFSFSDQTSIAENGEGTDTLRWVGDTSYEIAVRNGLVFTVRTIYDTASRDFVVRLSPAPIAPNYWLDVRYDLDSAGRTQRILPQDANPDTMTYVPDGMVTGLRLHGAVTLSYQTRPGHDLARVVYAQAALQTTFGADYIQDTVGRTAQQVKGGGGEYENYTYDARGRLTGFRRYAASPACAATDTLNEFGTICTSGITLLRSDTFTYDPAGNRTDKNALVDAADRLVRFNGDTMLYDADGNLTRRYRMADSSVFNERLYWNSAGQLDSVRVTRSGSPQTTRFGYDGFGRRVRKTVGTTTTYYAYSGIRVIGEYTGTGAFSRAYAYQPGLDQPHAIYQGGAWHYYTTDGRGNVRGLVNSAGTSTEAEYKYVPFGDTVSTAGSLANSVRFAGREFDSETGLYYNRTRYYDPTTGRFISQEDGPLSSDNRYSYAANSPMNQRDPNGRKCWWFGGQQDMAAPPVSRSTMSAQSTIILNTAGGAIECDVDAEVTGGGDDAAAGQVYWNAFYYDPLFENGGLPFTDIASPSDPRSDLPRPTTHTFFINTELLVGCPDGPVEFTQRWIRTGTPEDEAPVYTQGVIRARRIADPTPLGVSGWQYYAASVNARMVTSYGSYPIYRGSARGWINCRSGAGTLFSPPAP